MVRSVPGPCRRSASKRRSVSRRAFAFSSATRSSPRLGRVVRVEPADVRDGLPELLRTRRLVLEVGVDDLCPGIASAPGTMHQLVVMRFTTSPVSGRYGRRSRPARAGSRPSSARGACGPESEMRAACSSERWSSRSRHPRRDVVERVVVRERDALALHPLVEVEDVDVLRAASRTPRARSCG